MLNNQERPVCHRAEDLVTYLYGEASDAEARDFAGHLQQCDACRSEFGAFSQVHESIVGWRDEALGSSLSAAPVSFAPPVNFAQPVSRERKLTALAALREFFNVSPLWLRGAIGFAALLLLVLGGLTISRSLSVSLRRPEQLANKATEPTYSQQDVDRRVEQRLAEIARQNERQNASQATAVSPKAIKSSVKETGTQLAGNRPQPKAARPRGLSRQEREQLAADLRLIPRDEDDLPFGLTDEPNQ
jgi:anti-sigma factor RsiW